MAGLVVAGVTAGVLFERYGHGPAAQAPATRAAALYTCPMHPDVVRDAPGTCPVCGMTLVPHHAEEHDPVGSPTVTLPPGELSALNVRTVKVRRETLTREAVLSAYVQGYGASGTLSVTVPVAGRVVGVPARPGAQVRQNEVLLQLEIAGYVDAQRAFVDALASRDLGRIDTARQRLAELGINDTQIGQLENTRSIEPLLRVRAPQDGRIQTVAVRVDDRAEANTELLTLETPGVATVDADIYRSELLWMKNGDRAELRLPQTPGRVWVGSVVMEGALSNPQRRTFVVRANFPMPSGIVNTSMTGEVRFLGAARAGALTVPRDALIRTEHETRVVRALGQGRFQPVVVTPGIESAERVEIVRGLKDGDEVVVNAQFLIDAESSQRAEYRRLGTDPQRTAP